LFPNQNEPHKRGKDYLLILINLIEYLTKLLSLHGRIIDSEDPNNGERAEFNSKFYLWLLL